jgi:hypothetical protein
MFSATLAERVWNDAPASRLCRRPTVPGPAPAGAELVDQLDLRLDLEVLVVPLRADLVGSAWPAYSVSIS